MIDEEEDAEFQKERTEAGRLLKADQNVVAGLLSTPDGRFWTERVLEFCDMYNASFISFEALAVGTGRRQVGIFLLEQIELHAPDAYLRMIRERQARLAMIAQKKEEAERKARAKERFPDGQPLDGETDLERMMDQQARDLAPKDE